MTNQATVLAWTQTSGLTAPPGEAPAQGAAPPAEGASGAGSQPPSEGMIPGCGGGGTSTSLLLMLAMIAVFYFLLIRPQQKKAKEHQKMIESLKKGDEVITGGGLVGRVTGTSGKFATLEISEKVRVRVVKSQIAGPVGDADKLEKK